MNNFSKTFLVFRAGGQQKFATWFDLAWASLMSDQENQSMAHWCAWWHFHFQLISFNEGWPDWVSHLKAKAGQHSIMLTCHSFHKWRSQYMSISNLKWKKSFSVFKSTTAYIWLCNNWVSMLSLFLLYSLMLLSPKCRKTITIQE